VSGFWNVTEARRAPKGVSPTALSSRDLNLVPFAWDVMPQDCLDDLGDPNPEITEDSKAAWRSMTDEFRITFFAVNAISWFLHQMVLNKSKN
jgi:hypothetical protein